MNTIKEGSVLQDNDKRNKKRRVTVTLVLNGFAYYQSAKRIAKIRLDRIYVDGGVHSDGWSLVTA